MAMDPGPGSSRFTASDQLQQNIDKNGRPIYTLEADVSDTSETQLNDLEDAHETQLGSPSYRVYKRRFLGLAQLSLLNLIISWNWLAFAAISSTASQYYEVSETAINWLSTGVLFAFVVAAPLSTWVLSRYGSKASILLASILVFVGSWVRYGGAQLSHGSFAAAVVGQLIIGFAQPFVLAAPTNFSNTWFSDKGRVSATAVASLANPLGGAVGELVSPFWVTQTSDMKNMVLYLAVISTVVAVPAFIVPKSPPSPPSSVAMAPKLSLFHGLGTLPSNGNFWLLVLPFSIYVAGFNATSTLVNQILEPWGYSETEAGIAGGVLIVVGLIASAIVSPIIDRTQAYLLFIRLLVPGTAVAYVILIFMPQSGSIIGPYIILGALGATSFSLLPCALELLSIVTYPVAPELSSNIAWAGGQLIGGIFIVIMSALEAPATGWKGQPAGSMTSALIFQAVLGVVVVPCAFLIGRWRFKRITLPCQ